MPPKKTMEHRWLPLDCDNANHWGKLPHASLTCCQGAAQTVNANYWVDCHTALSKWVSFPSSFSPRESLKPSERGIWRPIMTCATAKDLMLSWMTVKDWPLSPVKSSRPPKPRVTAQVVVSLSFSLKNRPFVYNLYCTIFIICIL